MTIFDNFMKQARADLADQYRQEGISADKERQVAENKGYLFWENFEIGVRRLLPAAIIDYISPVDHNAPKTKFPVISLQLPECLEIKVTFQTDDNGLPMLGYKNPYLVSGIAIHLGQAEVIWNNEIGARFQPVFVANPLIAAAMAEERWMSLDLIDPLPELHYEPGPDAYDPFEEDFD